MNTPQAPSKRSFLPARPASWLIQTAQTFVRAGLSLNNRLHVPFEELSHLKSLPPGAGAILVSNHADETDPRIVLELSRRTAKRFISMCNREAFDEDFGLAGWALQRLGHFSVERGAHDSEAKQYAIDVLKNGSEVLVMFPEGEIFYLNETVQPFHAGAVDIAMQAIAERRKVDPNWTAYVVPMAIKYHYQMPIERALTERIERMESELCIMKNTGTMQERVRAIQKVLLKKEEERFNVKFEEAPSDLDDEVIQARRAMLRSIKTKMHEDPSADTRKTIDQSWRLAAELREHLANQPLSPEARQAMMEEINELTEVAQLASWRPAYYDGDATPDRLAEAIIKLERELFRVKRPKQLGRRNVFVRIAEPIDLGAFSDEYISNARSVRHNVTNRLQEKIQILVNEMTALTTK